MACSDEGSPAVGDIRRLSDEVDYSVGYDYNGIPQCEDLNPVGGAMKCLEECAPTNQDFSVSMRAHFI